MGCHGFEGNAPSYFISVGLPFASLIVAATVAWIAYQQWKTNKEKIRLDLYNRRFDVYSSFLNLFNALTDDRRSALTNEFTLIYHAFIKAQRESQFLFDPRSRVYKILEDIQTQSLPIISFKEISERGDISKGSEQYDRMAQQAHDAKVVLLSIFRDSLEKAIAPYLNFHKL